MLEVHPANLRKKIKIKICVDQDFMYIYSKILYGRDESRPYCKMVN